MRSSARRAVRKEKLTGGCLVGFGLSLPLVFYTIIQEGLDTGMRCMVRRGV